MASAIINPGLVTTVATGGAPVAAIPANANGGFIVNPYLAVDQGLAGAPEVLFVNPYGPATLNANGTTFALQPGQRWDIIPGQMTATTVNASTSGHAFSVVWW